MNQFLTIIKEHAETLPEGDTKWYLINMADEYEWMYEGLMNLQDVFQDVSMKVRQYEFEEEKKKMDDVMARTKELIAHYTEKEQP